MPRILDDMISSEDSNIKFLPYNFVSTGTSDTTTNMIFIVPLRKNQTKSKSTIHTHGLDSDRSIGITLIQL